MALVFKKSKDKAAAPAKGASKSAAKAAPSKPVASAATEAPKKSWFKTGNAVQDALAEEDKRIAKKVEESKKMWRFYLKEGETARITFVDGDLTEAGILNVFAFREHQLNINGDWKNWFPCTSEQEPCPICESGHDPALVGMMTIIDHREVQGKKGVYKDLPRLFVAKRKTIVQLQSLAVIAKGLAGCTFDVSRGGDGTPNVGDSFTFIKKDTLTALGKQYMKKDAKGKPINIFVPANYENEVTYLTAAELRKKGFGGKTPIGAETGLTEGETSTLEDELG